MTTPRPTVRQSLIWRDLADVSEAAFHQSTRNANSMRIRTSSPADTYAHDYDMQQYTHAIGLAEIHREAAKYYRAQQADAERAERHARYDADDVA